MRMRMRERLTHDAADRMEKAGEAFHLRLREGFLRLAAEDPGRIALISAAGSVEEVAEAVWTSIRHML